MDNTIKRLGQITKSKERVLFFEERRITPDAFQFPYTTTDTSATPAYWNSDLPNVMHGSGANFGFADGHADYFQWKCQSTFDLCKLTAAPASFTTYWTKATSECKNVDGKWVENAVWGVALP
jgi:prepilin-type processing-associated H-X9-DG protein